jgi:hypothetical protein
MKKISFLILFWLLLTPVLHAQVFKTSVSILGNLNNGPYHFTGNEEEFNTRKSSFNTGLAVELACYPFRNQTWYVASGIRLNTTEALVSKEYVFHGISSSNVTLGWNYRWQEITVPLYLGKTFMPFKNSKFYVDIYAGASLGVITTSMVGSGSEVQPAENSQAPARVATGSYKVDNAFNHRYLTTLDAGFRFSPVPALPNLSFGFFFAYNIQQTKNIEGSGYLSDETQGIQKDYYFNISRRFNNYTFSISYSFGRKWKNSIVGKVPQFKTKDQLDCPQ